LSGARASYLALAALVLLTALRLAVAGAMPLSPDEAYYWVWSRALAPGYPDHPPMVALWIAAGTALAGPGALGVRLLAPLSAAIGSLLLADAGARLLPGRGAGLFAAVALNATLLFGAGAVTMTPDTPLLFFWTAALWACARLLASGRGAWLLAAGIAAGLALASKYTAAFLGLGMALWLIATPLRRHLRGPWPWLGAAAALACFAPTIAWNADHGWASFLRQGGRAGVFAPDRALRFLGELIGGQVGLATPLLFLFAAGGIVLAARRVRRGPEWTLLCALSLPPVLVFVEHALGDRVQANWPAIVYPAAFIAAAGLAAPFWMRLRVPAVALGLAITLLVSVQAAFTPVTVPAHYDPTMRQFAGWPDLAAQVDAARQTAGATFVAVDDYGVAAELARLLPPGVPVVGVDPRWALFTLPRPDLGGATGLLVRSFRRDDRPDPRPWAGIAPAGTATRGRDGVTAEAFRLYRVAGRPDADGLAVMPRP
jgi:4-amino-4-deoxy-L-arabinose transferase-like glycosyltransferase